MLEYGRSQRNTARTVGVTLSTVQRVLQRFHDTGSNLRRPGTGRKSAQLRERIAIWSQQF